MVKNITNLSRSGLYDWVMQRISAVILGVYTVFLLGYIFLHPHFNYWDWLNLFSSLGMKIFTSFALFALVGHAWIGMWTITTDYLNEHVAGTCVAKLRFPVQLLCFVALIIYILWGLYLVWGF